MTKNRLDSTTCRRPRNTPALSAHRRRLRRQVRERETLVSGAQSGWRIRHRGSLCGLLQKGALAATAGGSIKLVGRRLSRERSKAPFNSEHHPGDDISGARPRSIRGAVRPPDGRGATRPHRISIRANGASDIPADGAGAAPEVERIFASDRIAFRRPRQRIMIAMALVTNLIGDRGRRPPRSMSPRKKNFTLKFATCKGITGTAVCFIKPRHGRGRRNCRSRRGDCGTAWCETGPLHSILRTPRWHIPTALRGAELRPRARAESRRTLVLEANESGKSLSRTLFRKGAQKVAAAHGRHASRGDKATRRIVAKALTANSNVAR